MLTIRLQRTGKKNQSDFRIVLAEKTAAAQKKVHEILGSYNPRKKIFKINEERVKYWLSQLVETSPTMHNLLVTKGLVAGAKVRAFSTPKKPVEAPVEKPVTAEAPAAAPTETPAPVETPPAA